MQPNADTTAPRVVLDTNVCLDLFVFRDPRATGLLDDLEGGRAIAITDTVCHDEWLRVLHYPQLQLDDAARASACVAYDALIQQRGIATPSPQPTLPRCADPDDQMFLELAAACGAQWLISRDTALLALSRRTQRDGLFEIITPRTWAALAALRT